LNFNEKESFTFSFLPSVSKFNLIQGSFVFNFSAKFVEGVSIVVSKSSTEVSFSLETSFNKLKSKITLPLLVELLELVGIVLYIELLEFIQIEYDNIVSLYIGLLLVSIQVENDSIVSSYIGLLLVFTPVLILNVQA